MASSQVDSVSLSAKPSDHFDCEETVVLVHGFGSKRLWMRIIGRRLERLGHVIKYWSYNSLVGNLQGHAMRLSNFLDNEATRCGGRVHVVAHSMGSIVTRIAVANLRHTDRIGRIVQLAPPNRGCPVARFAGPIVSWFCPAIGQLSDSPNSFVNQLTGQPGLEMGVIAGRYDFQIPVANTSLADQVDHVTTSSTHNSMLFQPQVVKYVDSFIRNGQFKS